MASTGSAAYATIDGVQHSMATTVNPIVKTIYLTTGKASSLVTTTGTIIVNGETVMSTLGTYELVLTNNATIDLYVYSSSRSAVVTITVTM